MAALGDIRRRRPARLESGLRRGSGHLYLYRCRPLYLFCPQGCLRPSDCPPAPCRHSNANDDSARKCAAGRGAARASGMPDGLTGPRGLAPSGKDPPWHPNPSPAAAHLARLLEGRNGMGDAWLAQTRFRCDSGVPVLPTTRIPLEAYNVADRTLPQYGATTDAT